MPAVVGCIGQAESLQLVGSQFTIHNAPVGAKKYVFLATRDTWYAYLIPGTVLGVRSEKSDTTNRDQATFTHTLVLSSRFGYL